MFYKKMKLIAHVVILLMLFQIVGPTLSNYVYANEGNELPNIFTFKTLKLGDKEIGEEIEGDSVIDISDGTGVYLEYSWDTENIAVKPGDWVEIEVPNAFKFDRDWENLDITLSDNTVVGRYSLIDGVLKFVFDEGINEAQGVMNGFVGFGLKFNLEAFSEDVVQEISFNDKSEKNSYNYS